MNITRRSLLITAAPGALALAGCGTTTPSTTAAWVTELQAIGTMVTQILPQLVSVGLPASTQASVATIVGEIQQALAGVNAAMSQSQGASVLATIENYINDLAPLVLPFVSLIPGGSVIGLIVAALPAIEAAINIVSSLTTQSVTLASTAPKLAASARLRGASTVQISQQYANLLVNRAQSLRAKFR